MCVVEFLHPDAGRGVSLWGATLATLPVSCSEQHGECASSVISLKLWNMWFPRIRSSSLRAGVTEDLLRRVNTLLIHFIHSYTLIHFTLKLISPSYHPKCQLTAFTKAFSSLRCKGSVYLLRNWILFSATWKVLVPQTDTWIASYCTQRSHNMQHRLSWNQWMLICKSDLLWINKILEAILERKLESFAQWGSVHYSCASFCLVSANFILSLCSRFISQTSVLTHGARGVLV